jgi:hypothetical protein
MTVIFKYRVKNYDTGALEFRTSSHEPIMPEHHLQGPDGREWTIVSVTMNSAGFGTIKAFPKSKVEQ